MYACGEDRGNVRTTTQHSTGHSDRANRSSHHAEHQNGPPSWRASWGCPSHGFPTSPRRSPPFSISFVLPNSARENHTSRWKLSMRAWFVVTCLALAASAPPSTQQMLETSRLADCGCHSVEVVMFCQSCTSGDSVDPAECNSIGSCSQCPKGYPKEFCDTPKP